MSAHLHRRGEAAYAALVFAMVGGLFLTIEFAVARPLPSLCWFLLLVLAILAWLATARAEYVASAVSQSDASLTAPATTEVPPTSIPNLHAVYARPAATGVVAALNDLAHEIRTPLHAVIGYAELLRDAEYNNTGAKQHTEFARVLHGNARHLQTVIDEVLEIHRILAGNISLNEQECDIAELAELALRESATEAEARNLVLHASLADGLTVKGDTARLKRSIRTILARAIAASPSDGIVNLNLLRAGDGSLVLSVTDASAGLAPTHVLEAQAESLALQIASEVMKLHQGKLTRAAVPGVGVEARLVLPPHRVTWPNALDSARHVA